jgi:hypothetical protein
MRNAFNNVSFMVQWMAGGAFALFATLISFIVIFVGGSFLLMMISHQRPESLNPMFAFVYSFASYSIMGLALGLIYGGMQKGLLRWKTDEPWRGWTIASAIGGVVGVDITFMLIGGQIAQYLRWMTLPPPDALIWIGLQAATIPFGVLALAQCFVLMNYVRGAWVWVLANLVSGIVLFGLIAAGALSWATSPLWMVGVILGLSLAPAIVTGFTMVWLLNMNWRGNY